jgi:hypothetical protein
MRLSLHAFISAAAASLLVVCLTTPVFAAEKASATGTWKWTAQGRGGGQATEMVLKLKQDGEKLTGAIVRNDQETAIKDGKVKDNTVSFQTSVERNGQKFTSKYEGKLDGDTIKGTIKSERNGQEMSREWEAKRAKDEKK